MRPIPARASGRRVWVRDAPAGRTSPAWQGERDAGGGAPAGIYIARVTDARGTTSRRWAWLGRR